MTRRHSSESPAAWPVGRPRIAAESTLCAGARMGHGEWGKGNRKNPGSRCLGSFGRAPARTPPASVLRSATRRACGCLPTILLLGALGCASGGGTTARRFDTAALTNPRLAPQYAQFLVGPLARVATEAELDAFAALVDDAAAEAFVERFWASRDPTPQRPGNPFRQLYDERAAEADKRFSQAAYLGRRTDRGTTWILHGPPDETDFEPNPTGYGELVEVWRYSGETARVNLNQRLPDAIYRFLQREDLKVFYTPPLGYTPVDRR